MPDTMLRAATVGYETEGRFAHWFGHAQRSPMARDSDSRLRCRRSSGGPLVRCGQRRRRCRRCNRACACSGGRRSASQFMRESRRRHSTGRRQHRLGIQAHGAASWGVVPPTHVLSGELGVRTLFSADPPRADDAGQADSFATPVIARCSLRPFATNGFAQSAVQATLDLMDRCTATDLEVVAGADSMYRSRRPLELCVRIRRLRGGT